MATIEKRKRKMALAASLYQRWHHIMQSDSRQANNIRRQRITLNISHHLRGSGSSMHRADYRTRIAPLIDNLPRAATSLPRSSHRINHNVTSRSTARRLHRIARSISSACCLYTACASNRRRLRYRCILQRATALRPL